jgi:hypothetical protein
MKHISGDHNEIPLDLAINQQLDHEVLGADQLRQLMTMQQMVLDSGNGPDGKLRRHWPQVAAVCAALVLGIVLIGQSFLLPQPDYSREIALEVVQNHIKLKPLDVAANSMSEIQGFFTQLDFSPVNSDVLKTRFTLPERSMLGGRYCSIKGITAAQLRYRQSDNALSTLYEVAYDKKIFGPMPRIGLGEPPSELLLKGLRVSLWVEKGLLMVLVTEA